jgi:SulP family sulfate permease
MKIPNEKQSASPDITPPPRPLFTATYWRLFVPKLVTVLRDGYGLHEARQDFVAGLTVAIVALPLSLALAIASGVAPERGLYTAIVAGFIVSAFGGSRFQIGGPTGAFVVVVFNVVQAHGYDGLAIATLMAAFILIVAGFAKLGTVIKYVPYPVVTGFTAGIAVIIFTSQVGELLGIPLSHPPAEVIGKWRAYFENFAQANTVAMALGLASVALIFGLRRFRPQWPAFLIVVVLGGGAAAFAGLSVTTIASRFGELPHTLPAPNWPGGIT